MGGGQAAAGAALLGEAAARAGATRVEGALAASADRGAQRHPFPVLRQPAAPAAPSGAEAPDGLKRKAQALG